MGGRFVISALVWCCLLFMFIEGLNLLDRHSRQFNIIKMENCRGLQLPAYWSNIKLVLDKQTKIKYFSLKLNLAEEISKDFWISITFLKCDSSGNPDSCEYLIKDKAFKNSCKYLEMDNQLWSEFVAYIDKNIKCPLKKGTYSVVDLPLNSNALNRLPIQDAIWKIQFKGYDQGKFISCVDMDVKVYTV